MKMKLLDLLADQETDALVCLPERGAVSRRQILAIAAVTMSLSLPTFALAAGSWDGAWGNGSPLIAISGHTISYSFNGKSYPVSGVKMSAKQLSFRAGQATIVMTPTSDGKANFHFTLNGQGSSALIWKQ